MLDDLVRKCSLVLGTTTLGILTTALSVSAAGLYSITPIAVPGMKSYNPVKITDNGQVLVSGRTPVTEKFAWAGYQGAAFVWQAGKISNLEFNIDADSRSPVGNYYLYDISPSGKVIGSVSLYDVKSDGVWYYGDTGFYWSGGKIDLSNGSKGYVDYNTPSRQYTFNQREEFLDVVYSADYELYLANPNKGQRQLIPVPLKDTYRHFPFQRVLNNKGQIAVTYGYDQPFGTPATSFLWDEGKVTQIGDWSLGADSTVLTDLNDSTQIIGYINNNNIYNQNVGFLWENGLTTDLGNLGGKSNLPKAINERGEVIGDATISKGESHAFFWKNGEITDLGTLGGNNSSALQINEAGQVLGCSTTAGGQSNTFVWTGGVMKDTGIPNCDGHIFNDSGQVVYKSTNYLSDINVTYFYDGERTYNPTDIETLLADKSGWDITSITGLNNKGQLIGTGLFNGEESAFVMTPLNETVPEPSTIIGSILAVGALARTARQRKHPK